MDLNSIAFQLPGAKILEGASPWQVFQQTNGFATIDINGVWVWEDEAIVQVRVASEYDGSSVPGCDWRNAEMLDGKKWKISVNVPIGGLYSIETRLGGLTGDKIWHISVGDIWVIAGQSNAVGYGRGSVADPPAMGVSLFGTNEEWRLAAHPIFDPTGTKHSANYDPGWVGVSPWLSFGKSILESAHMPIGLIPAALGGSPLCAWDPGSDNPFLFNNMMDMIKAAGGKIAGMVWYQGCSDTGTEHEATTYYDRFERFVKGVRSIYGNDFPVITAQLNRYIDALPEVDKWWSVIRESQRVAAEKIPGLAVVPTIDLPLSDPIHTSAVGNVILGQRFARAALGMVYGKAINWKAGNISAAFFVDENRDKIKISFNDINGFFYPISSNIGVEFMVEDSQGKIPVLNGVITGVSDIVINLSRKAIGDTNCSADYGANPVSVLRDINQLPILAFHDIKVEG